jgi:hypothetical protein
MIPDELKNELDKFSVEFKKHCDNDVARVNKMLLDAFQVIQRLNDDFLKTEVTVISKDEWKKISSFIKEENDSYIKMTCEHGEQCIRCQKYLGNDNWLNDILKEGKND